MKVYCPSLPTPNTCFLPTVLGSLETASTAGLTTKQFALACLTASVGAAVAGIFDAALHTVYVVLKAIPTGLKVTVGRWTGLDAKMSTAFDGQQWLTHAYKIYASAALVLDAITKGWWNPDLVRVNGKALALIQDPNGGKITAATVGAGVK